MKNILLLALFSQISLASYISIQGTPKITVDGQSGSITGSIELVNKGDELAQAVFPEVSFLDFKLVSEGKNLTPNKGHTWDLKGTFSSERAGFFPLKLIYHYQDGNSYPFSSANLMKIPVKKTGTEDLSALQVGALVTKAKIISMGNEFKGEVVVKNLSDEATSIKLDFVVPREISVQSDSSEMSIKGKSEETLVFSGKNLNALVGSNYIIHALVDYEQNGFNNFSSANAIYKVGEEEKFGIGHSKFWYWVIGGFLILFLIGIQFLRKK